MTPTWKKIGLLLIVPLVLLVGIVSLLQLEGASPEPDDRISPSALSSQESKQHIWIVLVDSLSDRLLGKNRLPFTDSLAGQGVSGSMKPCTDALTGPCLKAAFTGRDRFSVFALFDDFVFTDQAASGSVFETIHQAGYRIGIVATYSWKQFQHAFTSKVFFGLAIDKDYTDHIAVRKSIELLERDNLDVMITALRYFDNVTHKYKPGSKEYFAEALVSDSCVREIHDAMPSDWNLLVFGDHGHDAKDGRHVAGLDIPAGYVFYGPAFKKGEKKNLDIKSLHYILSILFDVPAEGSPPDDGLEAMFKEDWLAARTTRTASGGILKSASGSEAAGTNRPWPAEIMFIMVFTVLGVAAWSLGVRKISIARTVLPAVIVLGLVAIEGGLYTWIRPKTVQISFVWDYAVIAAEVAAAFAAAIFVLPGRPLQTRGLLAAIMVLVFTMMLNLPTVYNFGSARYVMHGALVAAAALAAGALGGRKRKQTAAGSVALLAGGAALLILMNIDMNVHDFQFHYFYWSRALFQVLHPSLVFAAAAGLLFYVLSDGKLRGIAALCLLSAFAALSGILPAWIFTIPLAAAFWMVLPGFLKPRPLRRLDVVWFVCVSLIVIFYFVDRSFTETTEMVVFFLIGALLFKALGLVRLERRWQAEPWIIDALSAVLALGLGLFTLWITSHMSMAGVRYQPVLNWFSAKAIARIWILVAVIVLFLYALPFAVFTRLLKNYLPDGHRTLVRWWVPLAAGKLVCLVLFIRIMTMMNAGQAIIRDTINTLISWILVALFGLLFYAANLANGSRTDRGVPGSR
jgi:hypothetical protein